MRWLSSSGRRRHCSTDQRHALRASYHSGSQSKRPGFTLGFVVSLHCGVLRRTSVSDELTGHETVVEALLPSSWDLYLWGRPEPLLQALTPSVVAAEVLCEAGVVTRYSRDSRRQARCLSVSLSLAWKGWSLVRTVF